MKSITIIALTFVTICGADDGRYRPDFYKSEKYQHLYDNRYINLAGKNSKYVSIYNGNDPFYNKALSRELQSPLQIDYGDREEIQSTNAYPTTITYRTPLVPVRPTYSPLLFSTPKPFTVTKSPSAVYHKTVSDPVANIVKQDASADQNNYHYAFETDNGIAAEESGSVDPFVNGVGGTRVRGFYEYIGNDGLKYRVDYVADENGYRASGAHLPKVPGTY